MTPRVNPDERLPLDLPVGWKRCMIADIANVEMGQSPPSVTYNKEGAGLPFFQGKADFGVLYATPRVWCSAPKKIAGSDDILLSVRAPVGPTNLAPAQCCIGRGLASIRPESGISLRFLLYRVQAIRARAGQHWNGDDFPGDIWQTTAFSGHSGRSSPGTGTCRGGLGRSVFAA